MITKDDKNYLTVKEFAAAANISDKAVYQQLKTRLKEYSINTDGITMIDEAAIKAFYNADSSIQVKLNQVESSLESDSNYKYITYLEKQIEEYKEQIKEKDNTIKGLQEQIINLSNSIANMSSESLKQISSITKNIQLLQAAEVRDDIISQEKESEIIEPPKKSWFDKLRGK